MCNVSKPKWFKEKKKKILGLLMVLSRLLLRHFSKMKLSFSLSIVEKNALKCPLL